MTGAITAEEPGQAALTAGCPVAERSLLRCFARQRMGVISAVYLAGSLAACLAAPVLAPYPPDAQDLNIPFAGPSAAHLLGTDELGRDVLSRLLYGGVLTFAGVGEAVAVALLLAVPIGMIAGYHGRRLDQILGRFADILLAMPIIVVLLMLYAIFAGSQTAAMIVLGILSSASLFRVVRGSTLPLRGTGYVISARVSGVSTGRILRRHILPGVAGPVLVNASVIAAVAVVLQVGMNFIGFGAQPPNPSWGGMISDAQQALSEHPWQIASPGLAATLTILAIVLLGDAMRDAFAAKWGLESPAARTAQPPPPAATEPSPEVSSPVTPGATGPPEPTRASALLSVEAASVWLSGGGGVLVTDQVTFSVEAGQAVGLLGESGAGKTMTALAILGLLPADGQISGGRCWFAGTDLFSLDRRQRARRRGRGIAYIGQEPARNLDPCFTVGAHLKEILRTRAGKSESRKALNRMVEEALAAVGIVDPASVAARYPHQLSGGMAQRASIAIALATRPRLLIADEPTTALDATVQAEILDLLCSLRKEQGLSVLLVTHDWGVAAGSCDRAVVMYAGQVVETGTVRDLTQDPLHPYTRALLDSVPRMDTAGPLATIAGAPPAPGQWGAGCRFQPRCPLATAECGHGPVHLAGPPGRASRCIHSEVG